ncbi:IS256 family transposase [Desulfovibrio oxyclinae]|uniref:IS256 family transposase n=1 Tax=Desulfovibrio oxyclinae TaxID=63560 RepID=UPI0003652336|nr:IS256 family transposase [Desulfovibrio oxyclinae]
MADFEVKLSQDQVASLLSRDDGFQQLLEAVLNQVLEAQMTEHIGAQAYERNEGRKAYRNGHRVRKLYTRVGPLNLLVPQSRDGQFSTEMFRRYQRSEQAFVLALMEMYLNGVSTRKVTSITEELCGASFSKSTVSQLCTELEARVGAWNDRPLHDKRYPFLVMDAVVIKVRRDEAVRSTSALIVIGISEEGTREILGIRLGDSETEETWEDIFCWLKGRGLRGVDYVISDSHAGLVKALRRNFQGTCWQRCQVHFMRNVLGLTPKTQKDEMSLWLKRILHADSQAMARQSFEQLCEAMDGKKVEKALSTLEEGLEDAISVLRLPEKYRRRLRTTNMAERLNEEIRRRERVIRIFPNEDAALRLVGALLAEQHEVWSTGRRYLNMDEYLEWREARQEIEGEGKVARIY